MRRAAALCSGLILFALFAVTSTFAATPTTPSPLASASPAAAPTAEAGLLQIFAGGRWCRGPKQGTYRVLVPPSSPGLSVQFVRSGEGKVAGGTTIAVAELASADLTVAGVRVNLPPADACSDLVIRGLVGRPSRGGITRERFELRVNQFGGYEIRFVPDVGPGD